MPTITLHKTTLEEITGKKLPLDQLKDRISMLGTDLESIEGDEITVEIFPNRPDLLSEQGFARAFSSFIGVKTGLRQYSVKKSGKQVIVDKSVTMRPYTACALVKNLTMTDERIREIMQMQEKLAKTHGRDRKKSAYGIYPLDNITFPITYIAKDPRKVMFRPLGMEKKIPAHHMEELHPKGKEYRHVAEGWIYYPFFIDAGQNVLSMLPYTNSHDTGKIELDTKNVFIECTGNDLENVTVALNMFVTMFADMGGDVYSLDIVYPDKTITTPDLTPTTMAIDLAFINKRLGLSLQEKDLHHYLERMGYGYEKGTALIPAYRADILHQVDLMEDIAIAYGYENFEETIPKVATIGEEDKLENFLSKVREILIGYGLVEIKNYHLTTKEDCTERMNLFQEPIPLLNAVGEHNHLRNAILPSLMRTLMNNQRHELPHNLFEIGRVFHHDKTKETGVRENEQMAVALAHEQADFTEIRQILDGLLRAIALDCTFKETPHPSCIEGRAARLWFGQEEIGVIGELHPAVLEHWTVQVPVVFFQLEIEKVFHILR